MDWLRHTGSIVCRESIDCIFDPQGGILIGQGASLHGPLTHTEPLGSASTPRKGCLPCMRFRLRPRRRLSTVACTSPPAPFVSSQSHSWLSSRSFSSPLFARSLKPSTSQPTSSLASSTGSTPTSAEIPSTLRSSSCLPPFHFFPWASKILRPSPSHISRRRTS